MQLLQILIHDRSCGYIMIDISFVFPFVLHNTLDRAHDISNAWIIVTCTYLVVLEMIIFFKLW